MAFIRVGPAVAVGVGHGKTTGAEGRTAVGGSPTPKQREAATTVEAAPTTESGQPAGTRKPSRSTNVKDGLEYVSIPPGGFEMGCVPVDSSCEDHEKPRHHVELTKRFWIGRTPVTVVAYERYASTTGRSKADVPSSGKPKDHPMVNVSWHDAQGFCQWSGGRLPTEAEWEYAARGGKSGLTYPLANDLTHDNANSSGTGGKDQWEVTSPVASFEANAFDLFDMAGNVWEWCADWFDPQFYSRSPRLDPAGPESGSLRVVRGGSWNSFPWRLRVSFRYYGAAGFRGVTFGFRCARDVPP
jgi:formylglycine-generating enzyme